MLYKNIKLVYNDEEFRLIRLQVLIDELYETVAPDYIKMIFKLEDIKGTLNVYWNEKPSLFYKTLIDSLWMDQYEININHNINQEFDDDFCPCCSKPHQKEDPEIKAYFS